MDLNEYTDAQVLMQVTSNWLQIIIDMIKVGKEL